MDKVRAYLAHRQGLLEFTNKSNREVLREVGWVRSVGGHNVYITLLARSQSTKAQTEQDAKNHEIYEFASARGCTYFLPSDDFQVGIKCGQGFNDASSIRTAKAKLGFTDDDLVKLKEGIVKALKNGALDTNGIKKELGDLVINFGELGKKVGQTTSLSLGLLSLQAEAQIRRVPKGWALEAQSYEYELFENPPNVGDSYSKDQGYADLAERYWTWIGLASLAHFQWFSGLGVGATKKAVEGLNLVPVDETDLLIHADLADDFRRFEVPAKPVYRLITNLDGLFLHRREIQSLIDPKDLDRQVPAEKERDRSSKLRTCTTTLLSTEAESWDCGNSNSIRARWSTPCSSQ
ncbi:MAG: crosslink repair DNA glycosylase YcaQ family protein [Armatimonadota bacterium]